MSSYPENVARYAASAAATLPSTATSTPLQRIASRSGGDLESTHLSGGSIWHSRRPASSEVTYEAEVPLGLHLGFGVADIRTHASSLGGFEARGPALSVLNLQTEPARFTTTIRARPSVSLGVHLEPMGALPESMAACERLLEKLPDSSIRAATTGTALSRCLHLLHPVDPWFQGTSRDLVLQARGLELIAVVETWLSGHSMPPSDLRNARRAEAARDYMESRLADPLTLALIARAVGINVRTLSTAFRYRFGMSVAAFLAYRRMDEAVHLLRGGASVAEAAYAAGYQPNAFSTAFRRHFGFPPSLAAKAGMSAGSRFPDYEEKTPDGEGN